MRDNILRRLALDALVGFVICKTASLVGRTLMAIGPLGLLAIVLVHELVLPKLVNLFAVSYTPALTYVSGVIDQDTMEVPDLDDAHAHTYTITVGSTYLDYHHVGGAVCVIKGVVDGTERSLLMTLYPINQTGLRDIGEHPDETFPTYRMFYFGKPKVQTTDMLFVSTTPYDYVNPVTDHIEWCDIGESIPKAAAIRHLTLNKDNIIIGVRTSWWGPLPRGVALNSVLVDHNINPAVAALISHKR